MHSNGNFLISPLDWQSSLHPSSSSDLSHREVSFLISKASHSTSTLDSSHLFKDFTPLVTPISPASPVFLLLGHSHPHMPLLYYQPTLRVPLEFPELFLLLPISLSSHTRKLKTYSTHYFLHFTSHSFFNQLQSSFLPLHETRSCQSPQGLHVVKSIRKVSLCSSTCPLSNIWHGQPVPPPWNMSISPHLFWPLNVGIFWACRPIISPCHLHLNIL